MSNISDVQVLGVEYRLKNTCLVEGCGACLPDDEAFQSLHMEKEHGLVV